MLDNDLASLYGVGTKVLIQAVKRNLQRFPEDFMFQLTWDEAALLTSITLTRRQSPLKVSRSQFVTLESGKNLKYRPYAFTQWAVNRHPFQASILL